MKDRNWLEIDVEAVRSNIRLARSCVRGKKIMGIVKADCYGLGAELALYAEDMLDSLGVATLEEALKLRRLGVKKDILVLGGIKLDKDNVSLAKEYGITLSLSDYDGALYADCLAGCDDKKLKVQLAVDSGMSRWGFAYDDKTLFKSFLLSNLSIEGVFSHLAQADEKNDAQSARQIDLFADTCEKIKRDTGFDGATHILNSAGIFRYSEAYGNTARLGIAMYGYAPGKYFFNVGLKPCAAWYARVVSVRRVKKGTRVSYGGTYVCDADTHLATLAVGYADGYPRALSNGGEVFCNGFNYRIAGRVCMDQCVIDIKDEGVKTGDVVELTGQNIAIENLAKKCDTINYEILSRISKRVERIFIFDKNK